MNIEEIDKWLNEEYGVSYTRLEELHDFFYERYTNLNCILTELEEWLKKHINSYEERIKLGKGYELTLVMQTHLQCDKNTLTKLQRLKEKYK